MSCARPTLGTLLIAGAIGATAYAGVPAPPEALSPGALDETLAIDSSCPTFSWAGGDDSTSLRLEVVALSSKRTGTDAPVLEVSLPGGARSWTPSADQCLERGGKYAWSLRSKADEARPTEARWRLFEVAATPSISEVEWARDVLRRHLAATSTQAPEPPTSATRTTAAPFDRAPSAESRLAGGAPSPPSPDAFSGNASFEVEGATAAKELHAVSSATSSGTIRADNLLSLGNGGINTPTVVLNRSGADEPLGRFWRNGNDIRVSKHGDNAPGTGIVVANIEGVYNVQTRVLAIPTGSWTGSPGGSGAEQTPSESCSESLIAGCIRMDTHPSICALGVVVGMRFWETDTDQLGLQVICTVTTAP